MVFSLLVQKMRKCEKFRDSKNYVVSSLKILALAKIHTHEIKYVKQSSSQLSSKSLKNSDKGNQLYLKVAGCMLSVNSK